MAMLKDDWRSRPRIDDILHKTIPALSSQSPNIAMFVPSLIAEIYEFLALFYTWYVPLLSTLYERKGKKANMNDSS